jgi:methyl-accepting chemotaxis protein
MPTTAQAIDSYSESAASKNGARESHMDQQMLSNLSIRTKIVIVVSILLAAVMAMGTVALREISAINSNLTEVQAKWLQSAITIGEMQAAILRYQTSVRDHLLADDPGTEAQIEKTLQILEQKIKDNFAAYETLKTPADERGIYDEFRKVWESYAAAGAEVLAASRNQDFATGRELFTNKLIKIGQQNDDLLNRERELNRRGAEAAVKRGNDLYSFATTFFVGGLALVTLLSLAIAAFLVRDVSRGIASIIQPMRALSQGDLAANIPHGDKDTEIGQMALTLQLFKEALVTKKTSDDATAAEANTKIARSVRVDGITREFESVIGELIGSLSSSSTELDAAANTLTTTADSTGKISSEAAAASQEVSSNVQSVAKTAEEITSSVQAIGHKVQEASRIACEAVKQAESTDSKIAQLSQSASRIGDVIKLITDVAEQTNLLALNATIEAARAGVAGRGFAVVASEVKALAAQTAKATDEIAAQIAGMQNATNESVLAIREIGTTINLISEISSTISAAVEQQGAATQEIARHVQHAAKRSRVVASNIADVSRGARETGSASSQVLSSARTISTESVRLRTEVERFLTTVRAA